MTPQRQSNFDLLRLLALFMVVLIHLTTSSLKILPITQPQWYLAIAFDAFARPAVHVFIMLGGYFLGTRSTSPLQALRRTTQIVPPLLLFIALYASTFIHPFTFSQLGTLLHSFLNGTLRSSFPQWYGHLWFLYPYAITLLFLPLITSAVTTLTQKQLQQLLAVLGTFFILLPSVNLTLGSKIFFTTAQPLGYFITSFLTGAYLAKYGLPFKVPTLLLWYLGASAITWGATVIQAHFFEPQHIRHLIGSFGTFDNMFVNQQLFVFLGAFSLVGLFSKLTLPHSPLISLFARSGFHGYIVHMYLLYFALILIPYKEAWVLNWHYPLATLSIALVVTILSLVYGVLMTTLSRAVRSLFS